MEGQQIEEAEKKIAPSGDIGDGIGLNRMNRKNKCGQNS
jgi:hypothetical protein